MSFRAVDSKLYKGLTLLEASAGTGKTYSLVRIIARHIVEHEIPLNRILTVTFTRAATAEIKNRLHQLLNDILQQLRNPPINFTSDLSQKWAQQGDEFSKRAIRLLSLALANFDNAPIFTIDGYFQRILKEYAFEAKTPFSVDLEPNEAAIVDTALRDYWRMVVYPMKPEFYKIFCAEVSFKNASQFISQMLRIPNAKLADAYSYSATEILKQQNDAIGQLIQLLGKNRESLVDFVQNPPGLKKSHNPFRSPACKHFPVKLEQLLLQDSWQPSDFKFLENLNSKKMYDASSFNRADPPDLTKHTLAPIFDAISNLHNAAERDIKSAFFGEILKFVLAKINTIKEEKNVQTYGDVTSRLDQLLKEDSPASRALKKSAHHTFEAVLIDEFQDTSPQQCSIFLGLFTNSNRFLHIVGDPKQSIYRFRGADVFSYIQARQYAHVIEHLDTNYRSSPAMVHAINQVFMLNKQDPFLVDGKISFHPSKWNHQKNHSQPSPIAPALYFNFIHRNLNVSRLYENAIFADICSEIIDLIGSPMNTITDAIEDVDQVIKPDDIAILVNTQNEGKTICKHLTRFHIPHVSHIYPSLTDSDEARDMLNILNATLAPTKSRMVKAALLTPTLGTGRLLDTEEDILSATKIFHQMHHIWETEGLMPMFNYLTHFFSAKPTILSLRNGLRRITNLTHLAEVLDAKARDQHLSAHEITHWLELAMEGSFIDSDTEVLEQRLSSDQSAVHILTQHSSKGLEFPIVFVMPPCKRNFGNTNRPDLSFHHPETMELIVDSQKENDSEAMEARIRESCADRSRLAYVALTRAKYRCHFYYVPEKPNVSDQHAIFLMLGEPSLENLFELARTSSKCIQVSEISAPLWPKKYFSPLKTELPTNLKTLDINKVLIKSEEKTTSFSGIISRTHSETSVADRDRVLLAPQTPNLENSFWTRLQAGAALGSAFHEILENIDFQDLTGCEEIVRIKLSSHSPWRKSPTTKELNVIILEICHFLKSLVTIPMGEKSCPFSLSMIPLSKRLIEPEFTLTKSNYSLDRLSSILAASPPKGIPDHYIESLNTFPPSQFNGFLTGFIDLIFEHNGKFHILDWKTNRLENYSSSHLCNAMAEHHYYLQYHLYILALDAFLKLRLGSKYCPNKHLGKVYYVFLRGLDPALSKQGIFCDSLDHQRLTALRSNFKNPC